MTEQQQDLGLATLHLPDRNWTAPVAIIPSPYRLAQPHCVVSVTNTSLNQVHILIDRGQQSHILQPGETRHGIEMLVSEVENFRALRAPGRMRDGMVLPPHPLLFDVPEAPPVPEPKPRKN